MNPQIHLIFYIQFYIRPVWPVWPVWPVLFCSLSVRAAFGLLPEFHEQRWTVWFKTRFVLYRLFLSHIYFLPYLRMQWRRAEPCFWLAGLSLCAPFSFPAACCGTNRGPQKADRPPVMTARACQMAAPLEGEVSTKPNLRHTKRRAHLQLIPGGSLRGVPEFHVLRNIQVMSLNGAPDSTSSSSGERR